MNPGIKIKTQIARLLILALVLASAGCGSTQARVTPAPTQTPEAAPVSTQVPQTVPVQAADEQTPAEPAQNKSLVVVFSCTGTTKGVAAKIAALTGAELVDIVPAQPYTTEDLSYNDRSTRATVEQNSPDARPKIL